MPSDIYMPALGMSQDTGVIAEWHKQVGDPVAAGDVVMSVETDKAVQDIEASDSGFIARILYAAGAEVPVGEVVATIVAEASEVSSASDEAVQVTSAAPAAEPEAAPAPKPVAAGKSSDIYMPALGMSQDTGVIAEWHKQVGDPVAAGDVVMSVETDKAVQDIEASDSGFIAGIRYAAGAEVPVGEVVATIVAEASAVSSVSDAPAQTKSAAPAAPMAKPEAAPTPKRPVASVSSSTSRPTGAAAKARRPLASPLARRLAREQGVDLARLWEHLQFRPVLANDVLNFQASSVAAPQASLEAYPGGASSPGALSVSITTPRLLSFVEWLEEQAGEAVPIGLVVARFLATVWRRYAPGDDAIDVDLLGYAERRWSREHISAVDEGGLLSLWARKTAASDPHPGALTVVDFTGSTIRSANSQIITSDGCILSYESSKQDRLMLTVVSRQLPLETLASVTDELGELLEQPLNMLIFS